MNRRGFIVGSILGSIATMLGITVQKKEKPRYYSCTDWDNFNRYITETDLRNKRAVILDRSGSISKEEMDEFFEEFKRFVEVNRG